MEALLTDARSPAVRSPSSVLVTGFDPFGGSDGDKGIGGQRLWLRDRAGNYFYFAHLSAFSDAAAEGARS